MKSSNTVDVFSSPKWYNISQNDNFLWVRTREVKLDKTQNFQFWPKACKIFGILWKFQILVKINFFGDQNWILYISASFYDNLIFNTIKITAICVSFRKNKNFFDTLSVFLTKKKTKKNQFFFKISIYEGSKLDQIGLNKPNCVNILTIFRK